MRRLWSALFLLTLVSAGSAQVVSNPPFGIAINRALSLEAGALAGDVPHHIHYDLKLYSHKGKLTRGTWDVWRDPLHSTRTEIVAGDYHYIHIEDLAHTIQWRHFNTVMPLKVYDLRQNFREPAFPVSFFAMPDPSNNVHFEQVEGMPFDCTSLRFQMQVCFDPLVHVLAFARVFNQTMTWEDWQPVGLHSVPRRFRIYDAGQIMVEAEGHVEVVKTFPPGLFAIPSNQPDMGEPEEDGATPHKVIATKPVRLDLLYGNLLVKVEVNAEGEVHKVDLIDADDDDLIKPAVEFAKHLTFAAQGMPFEQYIYVHYSVGVKEQ